MARGFKTGRTCFFAPPAWPTGDEVDFLVVLGGPMSANDEATHPWLAREKEFIREIIAAEKPVLGICLGAQLIANALGAAVYSNRVKEIGWFPLRGVPSSDASVFRFPPSIDVLHWHGETFDLPPGAVRLAETDACRHQAFQIGRTVLGLQFHLEMTPESLAGMVHHGQTELAPAEFVQSAGQILTGAGERCDAINGLMGEVLSFLAASRAG
jgi:GMP synthase-like glutamine amidotransferase